MIQNGSMTLCLCKQAGEVGVGTVGPGGGNLAPVGEEEGRGEGFMGDFLRVVRSEPKFAEEVG